MGNVQKQVINDGIFILIYVTEYRKSSKTHGKSKLQDNLYSMGGKSLYSMAQFK